MYRLASLSSRRVSPLTARHGSLKVVRRHVSSTPRVLQDAAGSSSTGAAPKKKRGFFKTVTLYSSGFLVLFYAASPVVAFNNESYKDFFYESVPFGELILEYAEDQGLDKTLRVGFFQSSKETMAKVQAAISKKPTDTPPASDAAKPTTLEKLTQAKEKAKVVAKETQERGKEIAQTLKTQTSKAASSASEAVRGKPATPKQSDSTRPVSFSEGVEGLVKQVEAALSGKPIDVLPEATMTPEQPAGSPPDSSHPKSNSEEEVGVKEVISNGNGKLYTGELPLGFEPPPGYSRPKKASAPSPSASSTSEVKANEVEPLSVSVADLASSEPAIAELASTIDSLTSYLKSTPGAEVNTKNVIKTAHDDLKQLAERIEVVRVEERTKLEAKLDEQAREYSMKLLETELSGQDKLDEQEMEFKHFFEEEQRKMIQAYRHKLDEELQRQSEIINERLKAEVIAQGIEMQRRWIREIKVHVEEERGGRLSKLDELATSLKKLERITLDNAEYLNENLRLHALWASLRAFSSAAIGSSTRRPFRDELRVLRHASAARNDELVNVVLETLESSDVPDVGVEPLADLTTWFTSTVAPQVAKVALVPERDAGVLSYIASYAFSTFQFRRHGLVEGSDVLSVLSRAEHYLIQKDLDNATRELNQLKGAPKLLLKDWLDAARRRLEVLQAIEVVEAQSTLASLLVV
ncbi:hypothetical protein SCHPADRAFT_917148 [Schizopora paradoxa]|uniref:MICOS complex subunit MIC60 n=1 Tax=Schizopora paradoxa TaxID=27342 RepID=A0A0H2R8F2_9AGAM|nr:hypothetical protein SCHPADRAFT_917148 [Schizopora paradoxa]